jgi:hypothetical protein
MKKAVQKSKEYFESSSTDLGPGTRALFFVSRETGHCPEENPPNMLGEF